MIIWQSAVASLSMAVIIGGLHLATPPVYGAYKPATKVTLKGYAKKQLKDTVSLIKDLEKTDREVLIAKSLGLCFEMEIASHSNHGQGSTKTMLVTSSGSLQPYEFNRSGMRKEQWDKATAGIRNLGVDAVLPSFTKEVTTQIYATAKYIISAMPQELKEAVLAEEGTLLYASDGKKAYTGMDSYLTVNGYSASAKHRQLDNSAPLRYRDSKGQEQDYNATICKYDNEWKHRREIIAYCISYTSRKEILALFPNELSALREAKKTESTAPKPADSTPAAPADAQEKAPSVSAPSTTTAMGSTVVPQASAALQPLAQFPKLGREAFLAERAELCYMPDGSDATDGKGELKNGAQFVGTDGVAHDFWQERNAVKNWESAAAPARSEGAEKILQALPKEVAALQQAAAIYHLNALPAIKRQAILAAKLGIYFFKAGGNNAFNITHKWINPTAVFVGRDGQMHVYTNEEREGAPKGKMRTPEWQRAAEACAPVEADVLCRIYAEELTIMGRETARCILNRMNPAARDAWLAEVADLLWLPNGKKAYTDGVRTEQTESGYSVQHRDYSPEAQFIDSEGKTYVRDQYDQMPGDAKNWDRHRVILHVCVKLSSKNTILSLVPERMETLRKNNRPMIKS